MKKKIWKITALVLALVMMLTMLAACGKQQEAAPAADETVAKAETTAATEPATSAEAEQTEKEIVSVEVYEDCDGSGHGVKIITYADGTQEEVEF